MCCGYQGTKFTDFPRANSWKFDLLGCLVFRGEKGKKASNVRHIETEFTREAPVRQQSFAGKEMTKQLTGKREDGPLHLAARAGDLGLVVEIVSNCGEEVLNELLSKQNHAGETALYLAGWLWICWFG